MNTTMIMVLLPETSCFDIGLGCLSFDLGVGGLINNVKQTKNKKAGLSPHAHANT